MDNKNVSTTYVPLQPPYQIIKFRRDIAMQIGTLIVTIQKEVGDNQDYQIETHSHPVVTYENKANVKPDSQLVSSQFLEGVVWNNVEVKNVTTICLSNARLSWNEFIHFLSEETRLNDNFEGVSIDAYWSLVKLAGGVEAPENENFGVVLYHTSLYNEPSKSSFYTMSGNFCFNAQKSPQQPNTWKDVIKEQIRQYREVLLHAGGYSKAYHIQFKSYFDDDSELVDFLKEINTNKELSTFSVYPQDEPESWDFIERDDDDDF